MNYGTLNSGIIVAGPNLFVADRGNWTIRKVDIATGAVTTFAGMVGLHGSVDGTGTAARFNGPCGVTTDGTDLFVADTGNYTVRKLVISTGGVTTIAGTAGVSGIVETVAVSGSADGTGAAATFNGLAGVTTDGANLYVAERSNFTIRKIVISTGVVTTIAGMAGVPGSTDGTGAAASFYFPNGITTDGANLFVTDEGNQTIRKIVIATGVVTTIDVMATLLGSTDGASLFVTDFSNSIIRRIQ
jgi:hypothetical protein